MGEKIKNYTMKYLFSTDNTNLIITLDTESGKYNPEITTINDPNITLENDRIWFFENGKYIRNFPFDHIGTISGVTPTSITDAFTKLNVVIDGLYLLVSPNFKGSIVPTDTPTGTEDAVWIATQAGTYTNFGGKVVSANSRAEISRAGGVFSISQTPIVVPNTKIPTWSAISFASGDQVNYLGIDWVSNAAAVAGDVPGVSSKWVERLINYRRKIHDVNLTGDASHKIAKISEFTVNTTSGNGFGISMSYTSRTSSLVYYFKTGNNSVTLFPSVLYSGIKTDDRSQLLFTSKIIGANTIFTVWALILNYDPTSISVIQKQVRTLVSENLIIAPTLINVANYQASLDYLSGQGETIITSQSNYTNIEADSKFQTIANSNKINTWTAKAYASGDQVNYLGKDWVSNAATVAGDVPGTSSKWGVRLSAYDSNLTLVTGKNKFNPLLIQNDKLIGFISTPVTNTYNGIGTSVGSKVSGFQEVLPNTVYYLYISNTANKRLMFYDSAYNPIGTIVSVLNTSFTTPSNCAFVNFTVKYAGESDSVYTTCQLELGSVATSYESFVRTLLDSQIPLSAARVSQLSTNIPKNVVIMGDSIAAGGWTPILAQKITFSSLLNLAVASSSWSHLAGTVYTTNPIYEGGMSANNVIWNQINKLIAQVTASSTPIPDVICIFEGTNDVGRTKGTAASAFSDAYSIKDNAPGTILDVATAIRYCCETIWHNYPNCQIILGTPIQRALNDNSLGLAVANVMKDCAKEMSIPVIDTWSEIGIYGKKELITPYFLGDGLHPNTAGNQLYASYVSKKLQAIINL